MGINEVFTVSEIAAFLKTSQHQVRAMIRAGELEAIKVGREYRVTLAALDAFLEGA